MDRRTRNVEIFKDSVEFMNSSSKLQQAIKESVNKQKLYLEAEEIETPESKGLSCKTVVSTKRSLEAASVYARDGKKVVVLKKGWKRKKYGTQKVNSAESGREARLGGSVLNMFDEISMTNPKQLAEFVGFTESEVEDLCCQYGMDFEETKRWYDGYRFENLEHVYSPRSVVSVMLSRSFDSYWNQTETFEALRDYIALNYAIKGYHY